MSNTGVIPREYSPIVRIEEMFLCYYYNHAVDTYMSSGCRPTAAIRASPTRRAHVTKCLKPSVWLDPANQMIEKQTSGSLFSVSTAKLYI